VLSPARVAALQGVPGWEWEPNDATWARHHQLLGQVAAKRDVTSSALSMTAVVSRCGQDEAESVLVQPSEPVGEVDGYAEFGEAGSNPEHPVLAAAAPGQCSRSEGGNGLPPRHPRVPRLIGLILIGELDELGGRQARRPHPMLQHQPDGGFGAGQARRAAPQGCSEVVRAQFTAVVMGLAPSWCWSQCAGVGH